MKKPGFTWAISTIGREDMTGESAFNTAELAVKDAHNECGSVHDKCMRGDSTITVRDPNGIVVSMDTWGGEE